MKVRLPTGNDIAKMLLLCAPKDALASLELSERTIDEFSDYFDSVGDSHKIDMIALALFYCNKSLINYKKSRVITKTLYFSPEAIHALVETVQAEIFDETHKLDEEINKQKVSQRNRRNRTAGHNKLGGYNSKKEIIIEIWASGKYRTRNECAEKEHNALGITYGTARKHLIGTPDPVTRLA